MPVSVEQPIIIKLLLCENVSTVEIYGRLHVQFGEAVLSRPRMKHCCNNFKQYREHITNNAHPRRPSTCMTNENIASVRELIERDQHFTVAQISGKQMGFRKVSTSSTTRLMNDGRKTARVRMPELLQLVLKKKGNLFCIKLLHVTRHRLIIILPNQRVQLWKGERKRKEPGEIQYSIVCWPWFSQIGEASHRWIFYTDCRSSTQPTTVVS